MLNNPGWAGLNRRARYNSDFLSNLSNSSQNIITIARVTGILLDNSDPTLFNNLGEWNGLGTISYESIDKRLPTVSGRAKPLDTNLKKFPLLNELVYIILAPNTEINSNPYSVNAYFINTLSLWNHPHHNAFPENVDDLPPSQQKDYIQTQAGSVRRITDESTEIDLGKTFREKPNVHPLLPFEGDIINEGRWGNSIRLSSTIKNSFIPNNWSKVGQDGDPILIIRNGQGNQTEEGWVPIIENINNDESSLYLTSTQNIPLKASSTDYTSYTTPPTTPDQYAGPQIILNSGRLVFNSWIDHILFSSTKTINLNSKESVNIDTKKFITQADKIFLGKEELATEPLLLGNTTTQVLRDLISSIKELSTTLQTLSSAPVAPNTPATFPTLLVPTTKVLTILNGLEKQLGTSSENCTITSKRNFTL